jgi:hypothetical protein
MKQGIAIFFFLLAIAGLNAQNASESGKPILADEENHDKDGSLDREYFETYYRYLPENAPKNKAKLEYNLIKNLKREILSKNYSKSTLEKIKEINPSNIQYERITRDSRWMRGIKKALPHLKEMEYMYIVKHGDYLCFISFAMNPEDYLFEPHQMELVYNQTGKYDIVVPAY